MKHKKIFACLLAMLLAVSLCGCGGDVRDVKRIVPASQLYSAEDVNSAMDAVVRYFRKEFEGCKLTWLIYDEAAFAAAFDEWAAQYGADEAIVLLSTFEVGAEGGDGSLAPNSLYTNWQWILTRSAGGAWQLQTWGYG